jgi:Uma2 family endonuclease
MSSSTSRAEFRESSAKPAVALSQNGVQRRPPRWLTSPPPYPVRRFTVAEYDQIARAGILTEDDNVELLEGWIVPKMTKYPPHDSTIDLVAYVLSQILPRGWFARVQNAVVTPDSEPEPDVAVVRGKPGDYRDRHPTGSDIGLIVEVADSTVRRDRRKANIYARAGVPHYWIVNLDEGQIEVYSQAAGKGKKVVYQSRQILLVRENVLTLVLDGKKVGKLRVGDILPQQSNKADNGK